MTGAYLRVNRDNKWQPIEVEHMTDDERKEAFQHRPMEEVLRWLNMTCKELAEIEVKYFTKEEQP